MNQYEREKVEQIKSEIRAYEEKNGKMPKEKKAYYIYRRMGQIYSYKETFFLYSNNSNFNILGLFFSLSGSI